MKKEDAIHILTAMKKSYLSLGIPDPEAVETLDMAINAVKAEPCEDAISRQAVLDGIDVKAWEFCDYLISKGRNDEQKPVSHFTDNLREYIRDELPPVNPHPKTGHWILDECKEHGHCSECGYGSVDLVGGEPWNFCSNCGCRMDEPQEREN